MNNKLNEKHFWHWFKHNHEAYMDFPGQSSKEQTYLMKEMDVHLRTCSLIRSFSLEHKLEDEKAYLIFHSCGKLERIEHIDHFVSSAPYILNWQFHALDRPRRISFGSEEKLEALNLTPDDIFLVPLEDEDSGKVLLFMHFIGFTERRRRMYDDLMHQILHNLLGERSFYLDIEAMVSCDMIDDPDDSFIKLEALPEYMSERKSEIRIEKSGHIQWVRRGKSAQEEL